MKDEAYTIPEARQAADQIDITAQVLNAMMTLLVAAAYAQHSNDGQKDTCGSEES